MRREGWLGLFVILGCSAQEDLAPVQVTWWLGNQSCEAQGVSQLRVSLYEYSGLVAEAEAACQDESVHFKVHDGEYSVLLEGLDEQGCVIMEGRQELCVTGTTQADRVPLKPRARPLRVRWATEGLSTCEALGAQEVRVHLRVGLGDEVVEARRCSAGFVDITAEQDDLTIWVDALDDQGREVAEGTLRVAADAFEQDRCVDVVEVKVRLCPGGCAAQKASRIW